MAIDQAQLAEMIQKIVSGGGTAALSAVNPIAAGLQAIPEMYKMGTAIKQGIQANQIRKTLERPVMGLPPSMVEATQNARMQAMDSRLPGQQFAENRIATAQAGANAGIMNSGGGTNERLAAMVAANQGANNAGLQLAETGAQFQAQDINNLNQQLNQQAGVEQQMWDYNQRQKFETAAAMASQLGTDSNRNAYSSLMGLGGAAASAIKTPELKPGLPPVQAMQTKAVGGIGFNPNNATLPMRTEMPQVNSQQIGVPTQGVGFNPNMQVPQRPLYNIPRPQYKQIQDVLPIEGYKPRGGFY